MILKEFFHVGSKSLHIFNSHCVVQGSSDATNRPENSERIMRQDRTTHEKHNLNIVECALLPYSTYLIVRSDWHGTERETEACDNIIFILTNYAHLFPDTFVLNWLTHLSQPTVKTINIKTSNFWNLNFKHFKSCVELNSNLNRHSLSSSERRLTCAGKITFFHGRSIHIYQQYSVSILNPILCIKKQNLLLAPLPKCLTSQVQHCYVQSPIHDMKEKKKKKK